MNSRLLRVGVLLGLTTAVAGLTAPGIGLAQVAPQTVGAGAPVAESAANMLRNEWLARKAARDAASAAASVRRQALAQTSPAPLTAPAPLASGAPAPGATPDTGGFGAAGSETPKPGFLHPSSPGIDYTVDLSSAFPYGNVGINHNNLKGGFDAQLFLSPERYTRILAGYYNVDFYPVGFDTGTVPTYIQNSLLGAGAGRTNCTAIVGSGNPICPAPLHTLQNDAGVQQRVAILALQKIVYIGGLLPIVISPSYIAQRSSIGGSDDVFLAYDPNRLNYQPVHLRTGEEKNLFVSLPFASSSKLFGVSTAGPTWNVNTCCNNHAGNGIQLFEELDLRYFASPQTTIFFQPSRIHQYYPEDPYPQNEATFIEGINHKFGGKHSPFFIQGFVVSGTPSNPPYGHTGRVGTIDVTCVTGFPACATLAGANPRTNTAVTFGGFKATNIILQVGIGTPSVVPI